MSGPPRNVLASLAVALHKVLERTPSGHLRGHAFGRVPGDGNSPILVLECNYVEDR